MPRRDGPSPIRYEWERVIRGLPRRLMAAPVRHVALTAATYADPDGSNIYPGTDGLVEATALSDSSVRRSLRLLREVGLLVRVEYGSANGRRGTADVYRLAIPADLLERLVEAARSPVSVTAVPEPITGTSDRCSEQEHRSHRPEHRSHRPDHRSEVPRTPVPETTHQHHDQPIHQPMTKPGGHVVEVRTDRARTLNGRPR